MTARQKRMMFVAMLVAGIGVFITLIMMALNENINHFFSPTEILEGKAPENHSFRIGGLVVTGSVKRDTESLKIEFDLTDGAKNYPVLYVGILPDLFREGQGIVATGEIKNNVFVAEEVLAKHDENYMPPEVADALKKSGKWNEDDIEAMKHPENVPVGAGYPLPEKTNSPGEYK
ncbi:MAG: cytochrome c maturation protein CcmE [Gammaproteobacteria bacterium]|nr:cytochrome c maturation protein CcmE [Gammaproteobacteria bacterium]